MQGWFKFNSRDVPGSIARWRATLTSDSRVLDQIEREFWAQVEWFRNYGLEPTHLNMHHYLPLIHIDLFAKFVDLANQLAVPFRGLCYPMINMLRVPVSVLTEMKAMVLQSGSPVPQISLSNLIGSRPVNSLGAVEYERIVGNKLNSLAMEGIDCTELITHPVCITDLIRLHDDYLWARDLETALVKSLSFARFLKRNSYCLVTYEGLR